MSEFIRPSDRKIKFSKDYKTVNFKISFFIL